MMTGNGVMHNGTTVLDDYGINLDRLQVTNIIVISLPSSFTEDLVFPASTRKKHWVCYPSGERKL